MITPTADVLTPFDPTGYATISGAGLQQLVSGVAPAATIGFIVVSFDTAGNPDVPEADTVVKWKRYLWLRVGASAVTAYVWNPNAGNDAIYRRWQPISVASIPAATIQTFMIADNAVTAAKIASVNWSSIVGAPAGFAPSGSAGGDLTGTWG